MHRNATEIVSTKNITRASMARYALLQRTELQDEFLQRLVRNMPWRWQAISQLAVLLQANSSAKGVMQEYRALMKAEWDSILPFLPETVEVVADIGCGIGGIHEFSGTHFTDLRRIYLIDKPESAGPIYYGFHTTGSAYNELDLSVAYLRSVNVRQEIIYPIDLNLDTLPEDRFDLVLSLLSWGFHFPVDTYLEYITRHLAEAGVLIIDIRNQTDGLECLDRCFATRSILEDGKRTRLVCTKR
jgi:SAM-dependent methyltransferase